MFCDIQYNSLNFPKTLAVNVRDKCKIVAKRVCKNSLHANFHYRERNKKIVENFTKKIK